MIVYVEGKPVTKACARPCYDCPFRSDLPVYQTPHDCEMNIAVTTVYHNPTICHHSVHKCSNPVQCAGSLAFLENCGVISDSGVKMKGLVFRSAQDMRLAVSAVKNHQERCVNYAAVQPKKKGNKS
jgi:hypothetical protein